MSCQVGGTGLRLPLTVITVWLALVLTGCAGDRAGARPFTGDPADAAGKTGEPTPSSKDAAGVSRPEGGVSATADATSSSLPDGATASVVQDARSADGPTTASDGGPLAACPAAPATYTATTTVHYANSTDLSQSMDVYVPDGPGPYPALVWIPGGGWVTGKKERLPATVKALAARGYVVVSISHRPSSAAKFPAQIQDLKAAIRFLRANAARFKLNPEAIGVSGDSSGGHLSALAGTSGGVAAFDDPSLGNPGVSSRVQAAAPFYGPSDFLKMNTHTRENGCPARSLDHDAITSPESRLVGCQIQTCPDKAAEPNPIKYISADDPPFLVQHGATDCTVPPGQSQVLYDALRAAGIPSQLFIRPQVGHSGAPYAPADFHAFLDTNLRRCSSRADAPRPSDAAPLFLLDRYHAPASTYAFENSGELGLSKFGAWLEARGFRKRNAVAPLDDATLAGVSVLMVVAPVADGPGVSPDEVAAVVRWVNAGGVLLLMGNRGDNFAAPLLSRLGAPFGLTFTSDVLSTTADAVAPLPTHPFFEGSRTLSVHFFDALTVAPPATAVLRVQAGGGAQTLMATSASGQGVVFAMGDPFVYNRVFDSPGPPYPSRDNPRFLQNLFAWIQRSLARR